MGITVEDRHLIKCLRVSKGYGATCLCKMFLDRQWNWNVDGVKTLIKKIDMTGSIDRQRGSGRHAVHVRQPTSTKLSAHPRCNGMKTRIHDDVTLTQSLQGRGNAVAVSLGKFYAYYLSHGRANFCPEITYINRVIRRQKLGVPVFMEHHADN